jgi:hypothetical protein
MSYPSWLQLPLGWCLCSFSPSCSENTMQFSFSATLPSSWCHSHVTIIYISGLVATSSHTSRYEVRKCARKTWVWWNMFSISPATSGTPNLCWLAETSILRLRLFCAYLCSSNNRESLNHEGSTNNLQDLNRSKFQRGVCTVHHAVPTWLAAICLKKYNIQVHYMHTNYIAIKQANMIHFIKLLKDKT